MASIRAKHICSTSGLVFAFIVGIPARAQEQTDVGQLQDIVVTAQKREQSLQKVPMAVTAIGANALQARGLAGVEDLSRALPGLQIGQASATVQPFLRGVGNSSTTIGNEASVAVYIDGVYYSRLPVGFFSLSNIDRVEVLKGPQGTLFGRNASGGVIQIITPDPSHNTAVKGSLSYGRFNIVEGSLYATTGLSDKLSADISVNGRRQSDGFGENLTTGRRTNYLDYFTARSKWLFEPSDLTRFTLASFYSYSNMGREGNTFPGTIKGYFTAPLDVMPTLSYYDQNNDQAGFLKAKSWGTSLRWQQELPFANFQSVSAYVKTISKAGTDSDYGPRPDQVAILHGPVKQFTQEFQFSSLKGQALEWVAGIYYFNTKSGYDFGTFFYSPNGSQAGVLRQEGFHPVAFQHAKSYAAYGQATYEFLPRVKFTGGLRFTLDRNSADGSIIRGNGGFLANPPAAKDRLNKLTFKAALDSQVTDDVLRALSKLGESTGAHFLRLGDSRQESRSVETRHDRRKRHPASLRSA